MAEPAQDAGGRLIWQTARIVALEPLTPRIRRVVLRPHVWHLPQAGQHLDVRLTADDGYRAQRSYSLLSPPEREGEYELGIELMADGEVSPWFHEAAQVDDELEVLGPVGGHFVWNADDRRPTLLIGGGSGVVPLMSMAAHHAHRVSRGPAAPMMLMASVRTQADVLDFAELQRWEAQDRRFQSRLALSRETVTLRPQDRTGRLCEADVAAALHNLSEGATESTQVFICGRNAFVETVIAMLRALKVPDSAIRTERFGG